VYGSVIVGKTTIHVPGGSDGGKVIVKGPTVLMVISDDSTGTEAGAERHGKIATLLRAKSKLRRVSIMCP
jgi:hypothetical protein